MIRTALQAQRAARSGPAALLLASAAALTACATTSAPPAAVQPALASFTAPLRLNGTEPFWGGRIAADGITLSGAERPEIRLPSTPPAVSATGARWRTPADPASSAAPSTVLVTAVQAGAGADAIATNVVRPIENALYNIEGVQRVSASNTPGRSIITVAFLPGASAEARGQAVRTALGRLRLPARASAEVTLSRPQPVEITLLRETCSDGMSDRAYPFTATVLLAGETLRGCAIPEAQWSATR